MRMILVFVPLVAVLACGVGVARADALDAIRQRGVLVWGADAEGGGPYVYPRTRIRRRSRVLKWNWRTCWPANWV